MRQKISSKQIGMVMLRYPKASPRLENFLRNVGRMHHVRIVCHDAHGTYEVEGRVLLPRSSKEGEYDEKCPVCIKIEREYDGGKKRELIMYESFLDYVNLEER